MKKVQIKQCGGYHSGAITDDGQLYIRSRADAS